MISREGDDALLGQVAELTVGYSGAELANLMNESAILAVRFEAVFDTEMKVWGLGPPRAPSSQPRAPTSRPVLAVRPEVLG